MSCLLILLKLLPWLIQGTLVTLLLLLLSSLQRAGAQAGGASSLRGFVQGEKLRVHSGLLRRPISTVLPLSSINGHKMESSQSLAETAYISVNLWKHSDCTKFIRESVTYGLNTCLNLTATLWGDFASTMYVLNISSSVLMQYWYSGSSCLADDFVVASPLLNVSSFSTSLQETASSSPSCHDGVSLSMSSGFSRPNTVGLIIGVYPTRASCISNTPFEALYYIKDEDDDHMDVNGKSNDDYLDTVVCEKAVWGFTNQFSSDDDTRDDDNYGVAHFQARVFVFKSIVMPYDNVVPWAQQCFAGSETVLLASGERKFVSEVVVGDFILSSDRHGYLSYSRVISVPHEAPNHISAVFLTLLVASGASLRLTPSHLVLVQTECNINKAFTLLQAQQVQRGMCLVSASSPSSTMSQKFSAVLERVTDVSLPVVSFGIYTVVTEQEFVVVNGFVASPFAVNHAWPHAYYNILRALPLWAVLYNSHLLSRINVLFGSFLHELSKV